MDECELTRQASSTLLSSLIACRSAPHIKLHPKAERELRTFYEHLMATLSSGEPEEGWRRVRAKILAIVRHIQRRQAEKEAQAGTPSLGAAAGAAAIERALASTPAAETTTARGPGRAAAETSGGRDAEGEGGEVGGDGNGVGNVTGSSGGNGDGGGGGGGQSDRATAPAAPSCAVRFVVHGSGPREGELQRAHGPAVLCGRFVHCDVVLGHEQRDGVAGENLLIGRVQFIMICTGRELLIFDCWSKCGTRTVARQLPQGLLGVSCHGDRRLLLFRQDERFTLEVGQRARVTFNPAPDDLVIERAPEEIARVSTI